MSEENAVKPEGKGLAIGGFILSLVGLVFCSMIFAIVFAGMMTGGGKGLMYFWVVLCLASVVLSAMGMMKLGKTGGKRGLAIAGLVIGIVAVIYSIWCLMALNVVEAGVGEGLEELGDALESLESLEDL